MYRTLLTVLILFVCESVVAQTVRIELNANHAHSDSNLVTIADIASIQCQDSRLKSAIGELDLHEFAEGQDQTVLITAKQVGLRIAVAGFNARQIELVGQDRCEVQRVLIEDFVSQLNSFVKSGYANHFGFDEQKLHVSLMESNDLNQLVPFELSQSVIGYPNKLELGSTSLSVTIPDAKRVQRNVNLRFRIMLETQVLLSQRNIARGEIISEGDVKSIQRMIADSNNMPIDEECLGKPAAKNIGKYEMILASDVDFRRLAVNRGNLLNRNDIVDAVVQKGKMKLRLRNTRVLTAGNIGDSIQIVNPETKTTLTGIVQDKTTVLVR